MDQTKVITYQDLDLNSKILQFCDYTCLRDYEYKQNLILVESCGDCYNLRSLKDYTIMIAGVELHKEALVVLFNMYEFDLTF